MDTDYLVFDKDGELIDVLRFNSEEELNLYKEANPEYSVKVEELEDFFIEEDNDMFDPSEDLI